MIHHLVSPHSGHQDTGGLSAPDYGQAEEQGRVQNFLGEAPASIIPFFSLSEDLSIATVCILVEYIKT